MNPRDRARYVGAAPTWLSQTFNIFEVTNPMGGVDLYNSGALEEGVYDIFAGVGISAAALGQYFVLGIFTPTPALGTYLAVPFSPAAGYYEIYRGGLWVTKDYSVRLHCYYAWTGTIGGICGAIRRV